MPQAVSYLISYAVGAQAAATFAYAITAASYIITAAAVPALGSANRRQATRRARGRQ